MGGVRAWTGAGVAAGAGVCTDAGSDTSSRAATGSGSGAKAERRLLVSVAGTGAGGAGADFTLTTAFVGAGWVREGGGGMAVATGGAFVTGTATIALVAEAKVTSARFVRATM